MICNIYSIEFPDPTMPLSVASALAPRADADAVALPLLAPRADVVVLAPRVKQHQL